MATPLEQLVVELRGDIGSLRSELRVAEQTVGGSARRMQREGKAVAGVFSSMSTGVKAFGGALAAVGVFQAVRGLASLTRSAIEQTAALRDQADKVGLTAERYQELRSTLRQTGGEVGALDSGLSTFARNLSNLERGTGSLAGFLKKADPEFAQAITNARNTDEALSLLADRVASLSSQEDRLALAQAALGRGGREFVNALAAGSAGLREQAEAARAAGEVIGDEAVNAADRLGDAVDRLTDVAFARFATGAVDAAGAGQSLADVIEDPETIRAVGKLAGEVGDLASSLLDLARSGLEAIRTLTSFNLRDLDTELLALSTTIADLRASGAEAEAQSLEPRLRELMFARNNREVRRASGVGEPGSLPEPEPERITPPAGRRFGRGFAAGAGGRSRADRGPDPLERAIDTFRFEEQQLERIVDTRKAFEEEITRDFEQATSTREELIEREAALRIEKLEELGFSEQEAADLRVKIQETAHEKIEDLESESAEALGRIIELGTETLADFLAGALLEETDQSFGELVKSFARTLLRMEILAAASSLGKILQAQLGASAGAQATGGGAGGIVGAILGRLFKFQEGGIVNAPVLGLIGEDARTRPEVVAPLEQLESMVGGHGATIEVVNNVPGVRASGQRIPDRNGRERFRIELKAAITDLASAGELRNILGGQHAPGLR